MLLLAAAMWSVPVRNRFHARRVNSRKIS